MPHHPPTVLFSPGDLVWFRPYGPDGPTYDGHIVCDTPHPEINPPARFVQVRTSYHCSAIWTVERSNTRHV